MPDPIRLYWKSTCSKCVRAHNLLQELGVEFEEREYSNTPLTAQEIRQTAPSRSLLELINPARDAYKEAGFDINPPTEEQALAAMAENNNLIFRPITLRGDRMVTGFDEAGLRSLVTE